MGQIKIEEIPVEVLRAVVGRVLNPPPVEFHHVDGVRCPVCRMRLTTAKDGPGLGVTSTRPWQGTSRERYHTCPVCGDRFKSVESARAA